MMPVWQVVLALNLALAIGLGLGYAGWGRRAATLDREFEAARAHVERLEREREACAGGARTGQQQWSGRGVVRAIYPQLVVITHEEIRGLLPARTTGFRTAAPNLGASITVGDPVRFSIWGTVVDDTTWRVIAYERERNRG
jgi:Copper binding periplasmic protein CusF